MIINYNLSVGHTLRLFLVSAAENNIFILLTANMAYISFTQYPANSINNIAFTTTIGANYNINTWFKIYLSYISK